MVHPAETLAKGPELAEISGTPLKVSRVAIGTWAICGWLWGGTDRMLDQTPWWPDPALRLIRNLEGIATFPHGAHQAPTVAGSARFWDAPLYHLDLLLTDLHSYRGPDNFSDESLGKLADWAEYDGMFPDDVMQVLDGGRAFNGGKPDNISFDANNNPVSVNNGFFDRCTPNAKTGCQEGSKPGVSTCAAGEAELGGTGFGIKGRYCAGIGGRWRWRWVYRGDPDV